MKAEPLANPRFIRRTQLAPSEYRKNFHQIDRDVIAVITSPEADRVTPMMSKIYLRMVAAPAEFWERAGVLYFAPRANDSHPIKASKVLYELLGVASATAHKALRWLHGQGIIGYYAGKNGVGIRIFLNRAVSSIGVRNQAAGKKILPFARGSDYSPHGSTVEPAFKDSFAVSESLDLSDPPAPKIGADNTYDVMPEHILSPQFPNRTHGAVINSVSYAARQTPADEEMINYLLRQLEPAVCVAATTAAKRAHENTCEWLEHRGLPKAARVAQREAYNVLRQHGLIKNTPRRLQADPDAERQAPQPAMAQPLPPEELRELAETCIAMLEVHGQGIDVTLSALSIADGGCLLPEDVLKVRELAQAMAPKKET